MQRRFHRRPRVGRRRRRQSLSAEASRFYKKCDS